MDGASNGKIVNIHKLHNEYDFSNEVGVTPRLRQSTIERWDADGKLLESKISKIESLSFDQPSLDIFDPKQFLPPESKMSLEKAQFSWGRIFCIVTGLAMIVFALWKKFTRNTSQPS